MAALLVSARRSVRTLGGLSRWVDAGVGGGGVYSQCLVSNMAMHNFLTLNYYIAQVTKVSHN